MNIANPDYIKSYCLDKFKSNYRLSSDEGELIVPSIFVDNDYRRHMSINLGTGLWRCFKTGNSGHFIKLYSTIEKVPYRKAYEKFLFEAFIADKKEEPATPEVIQSLDDTSKFELLQPYRIYDSGLEKVASELLESRMMHGYKFYVSKEGFYKDRLIIPFFNLQDEMFFFQARALMDGAWPKYLNSRTIKASDILYPFAYDSYDPLYVTEGVLDCLTLKSVGINATTTLSCVCSDAQMEQLKFYRGPIVVAYDSDSAGKKGVSQFLSRALKHKRSDLLLASPNPWKDWNDLLVSDGPDALLNHAKDLKELNKLSIATSELQTSGSSSRTLDSRQ